MTASEDPLGATGLTTRAAAAPEADSADPHNDSEQLSLSGAAGRYDVSLRSLQRLVTLEQIPARLVPGARGREWRVTVAAMEAAGYTPRRSDVALKDGSATAPEIRRLRHELHAERARTNDLDARLGYAMLTVGRLRGRLREAGIDPDELFGGDLDGPRAAEGGEVD